MSKRQDFRSKFPRFCSDADEFRELEETIPHHEKVLKVLMKANIANDVQIDVLRNLAKKAVFRKVKKGQTLYVPEDTLPYVIVVCSGQVVVYPIDTDKEKKIVGVGEILGEEDIMSKHGRLMFETAVVLTEGSSVAFIDRFLFRQEVRVPFQARIAELEDWILNGGSPELAKLNESRATAVAKSAVLRLVKEGEEIYKPGDKADAAFCVRHGFVRIGSH